MKPPCSAGVYNFLSRQDTVNSAGKVLSLGELLLGSIERVLQSAAWKSLCNCG